MSPDGNAVIYVSKGKRALLNRYDLRTGETKSVKMGVGVDVQNYWWVDSKNLVLMPVKSTMDYRGLMTVSSDFKKTKNIMGRKLPFVMVEPAPQKPGVFYGSFVKNKNLFPHLFEISLKTGSIKRVAENPGHIHDWLLDPMGNIRHGKIAGKKGWYLGEFDEERGEIRVVRKEHKYSIPMGYTHNGDRLVNLRYDENGYSLDVSDSTDLSVSYQQDFSRDYTTKPDKIFKDSRSGNVVGVRQQFERPHYVWYDERYQVCAEKVAEVFPEGVVEVLGFSKDQRKGVFQMDSDQYPGFVGTIDMFNGKVERLVDLYPNLKHEQFNELEPVVFRVVDGMKIEGYLTRAKSSAKKSPLLVMLHGGPHSRDVWGFDSKVQYFSNMGYHVLQVNYRGSSGYGSEFRMQNDLPKLCEAAVKDIIDAVISGIYEGYVDRKKIAIYGSSFGGYLAFMCAQERPELFTAVIGDAGVYHWDSLIDYIKESGVDRIGWSESFFGEFVGDYRLRAELSPVYSVDRLRCEVLLMHGRSDAIVPVDQAKRMAKALGRAGVDYQLVTKSWGKNDQLDDTLRMEYFQRITDFLDMAVLQDRDRLLAALDSE